MADEAQDTNADPEEAVDDAADETAAGESSPSGGADDATSAGAAGPDVEPDEAGVAEVTDHSTRLNETEKRDPLTPGQPRGIDPGTFEDRDAPPQL